ADRQKRQADARKTTHRPLSFSIEHGSECRKRDFPLFKPPEWHSVSIYPGKTLYPSLTLTSLPVRRLGLLEIATQCANTMDLKGNDAGDDNQRRHEDQGEVWRVRRIPIGISQKWWP